MNTDFLYGDLSYKVRGAIFSVFNELGNGHKEEIYQKALTNELTELGIPFEKEVSLTVKYKDKFVGLYRPDFVIDKKIVVELKALEYLPKASEVQLVHYLKTTGFNLGLLVNFGSAKLYIKRLIWTENTAKAS